MTLSGAHAATCGRGFSLIELLVVLAIIVTTAGMVVGLSTKDRQEGDVRAAAEELAATLRLARARAMDQASVVGVAFNIRNGVGTSGRVLNNADGGHWYRIIGSDGYTYRRQLPAMTPSPSRFPTPVFWTDISTPRWEGRSVKGFLKQVQEGWIGDRHTLPPKKVRFLALSDQDNGSLLDPVLSNGTQTFVDTYPRPWFGTWLAGRLYPWGGYAPTISDPGGRSCSGFYYQGDDGVVSGCRNPADRLTTWETSVPKGGIFSKDAGRPLINADWLDYVLGFYPDGSALEEYVMRARFESYGRSGVAGGGSTGGINKGDLGHMTGCSAAGIGIDPNWPVSPMTSYVDFTGNYYITLCPDIVQDTDSFASPGEAMKTLMPAYRVLVSRRGQVRVEKVLPHEPTGAATTYLPAVTWNNLTSLRADYRFLYRTTASGGSWIRHGRPVTDFLTPERLDATAGQTWWIAP